MQIKVYQQRKECDNTIAFVNNYIDEFLEMEENFASVTVKHLINTVEVSQKGKLS